MKFNEVRWIIIVMFFVLSITNIWFGLFGVICMGLPIFQALRGKGKLHCKSHCPRGSFLSKVVSKISLRNSLPKFMLTNGFKNTLLIIMGVMLTISMIHSGGNPKKIAFGLFRLMGISFIFGIVLGIFFKPKAWCAICPMGHSTTLITNLKTRNKFKREQIEEIKKKRA